MSEEPPKLLDFRTPGGSRQFAEIPDRIDWNVLHERLVNHPDFVVTESLTDGVTQWIHDFTYRGFEFTVDTQFGELWLFVADASCDDEVLHDVLNWFLRITG